MLEGHQDKSAAKAAFMQIFETTDREKSLELLKRLTPIFVGSFVKNYHSVKKIFVELEEFYRTKKIVEKTFFDKILYNFSLSLNGILLASAEKEKNQDRCAEYLGYSLGIFLAVVEYGITSTSYRDGINGWKHGPDQFRKLILDNVKDISGYLKAMNKSIKQKFIMNRIEKIARKHVNTLSKQQQELISSIAAMFV